RLRQDAPVEGKRYHEERRGRDDPALERDPGGARHNSRPTGEDEVEAEEERGREPEHVAANPARIHVKALADQGGAAQKTEAEPRDRAGRDPLLQDEPRDQDDEERRRGGEEGGVGD